MDSECWSGSKTWESWKENGEMDVWSVTEREEDKCLAEGEYGHWKDLWCNEMQQAEMDGACVEEGGKWLGEEEYGYDCRRE